MRERWFEGTYLGQRFSSNEHYVAAAGSGKVFRTRSVQATGKEPRFEDLEAVVGVPWAPTGVMKNNTETVPRAEVGRPEFLEIDADQKFIPRGVYITREV